MPNPRATSKPKGAGVTYEDLRQAALALPGVEDGTSYGTPALKVKGKLFVRLREEGDSVVLRTELDEREILLAAEPEVFYLTDHYRSHPWVLARLDAVRWESLAEILERAWRHAAPRKLLALRDGG